MSLVGKDDLAELVFYRGATIGLTKGSKEETQCES
jgi:hypothetical protein